MSGACYVINTISESKGRGLVAAQPISQGRIIVEETPYSSQLFPDSLHLYCDCCFKTSPSPAHQNLLRCSGCKVAHYINQDHQRTAWKNGHKEVCAAIKSTAPRIPSPSILLAIKVIITAHHRKQLEQQNQQQHGDNNTNQQHSGYQGILSLVTHWDDLKDEEKITCAQMGALAWQLLQTICPPSVQNLTPRDIAMLMARFKCNLHTICDNEQRSLGNGIFPLISMINHGCRPNAVQSFSGSKMTIRAIKDINPGEEITITYTEIAVTRWERRQYLLNNYYFDIDKDVADETNKDDISYDDRKQHNGSGIIQESIQIAPDLIVQLYGKECPWPCDGMRDEDLTSVHVVSGSGSTNSKMYIWGEFGDIVASSTKGDDGEDDFNKAAASFGLDDDESHEQGKQNKSKSTSKEKVALHVWGYNTDEISNQSSVTIPNLRLLLTPFATAYARALKTVRLSERQEQYSDTETTLQALENIYKTLTVVQSPSTVITLGAKHVLRMRILAALMKTAISQGTEKSFNTALQAGRDLVPIYEYVYPTVWPALGLHYAQLAKLEHYIGDVKAAATFAHSAIVVLETCLGGGSGKEVLHEMERIRREAQGEWMEGQRIVVNDEDID